MVLLSRYSWVEKIGIVVVSNKEYITNQCKKPFTQPVIFVRMLSFKGLSNLSLRVESQALCGRYRRDLILNTFLLLPQNVP